jgi:hypothetical protein
MRNATRLAALLGRLWTIAAAYLGASLASGLVIALAFLLAALVRMIYEGHWQEAAAYTLTGPIWVFMFTLVASLLVAAFTFLPALLFITLGEAARIRAAAFYSCWGAIAAVVSYHLYVETEGTPSRPLRLTMEWTLADVVAALVLVAAGVIGGLVYWALAVSNAADDAWAFLRPTLRHPANK